MSRLHEQARAACPHCPDGHERPESRPWAVFVASEVDSDGQPTHLYVAPTAGQHVAESDAEWVRARLNEAATRTRVVTVDQIEQVLADHTWGGVDIMGRVTCHDSTGGSHTYEGTGADHERHQAEAIVALYEAEETR